MEIHQEQKQAKAAATQATHATKRQDCSPLASNKKLVGGSMQQP